MPKSKRKKRSNSKTGYFGVVKQLNGGKYQAYIQIDGKKKYLGSSYKTAKQAAQAHDKEAIKLRRPFSKLNFPEKTPDGYTPRQQALVSRNTVGYRGVSKRGKNYHAQIRIGGKVTPLGTYDTAKEAAIAYDRAVLKANQPTTLLNFPDMVHNLAFAFRHSFVLITNEGRIESILSFVIQIKAGQDYVPCQESLITLWIGWF